MGEWVGGMTRFSFLNGGKRGVMTPSPPPKLLIENTARPVEGRKKGCSGGRKLPRERGEVH